MPIFEFTCTSCQKHFEELVNNSEKIFCPFCQSEKIEKNISSFGTISDDTRFETHAKDLPSLAQLQQYKKTGSYRNKPR